MTRTDLLRSLLTSAKSQLAARSDEVLELRKTRKQLQVQLEHARTALKKLGGGFATRGGCCGICGAGEDEECGEDCGAALARSTLKTIDAVDKTNAP